MEESPCKVKVVLFKLWMAAVPDKIATMSGEIEILKR